MSQNNSQNQEIPVTPDFSTPTHTNKNCKWVLNNNEIASGAMGTAAGGVSFITSICSSTQYMAGVGLQFNGVNNARPVVPAAYCCSL